MHQEPWLKNAKKQRPPGKQRALQLPQATLTCAAANLRASSWGVVVQGWLLSGMSTSEVKPPAEAALVPVSNPAIWAGAGQAGGEEGSTHGHIPSVALRLGVMVQQKSTA
jgi:hypothetical protein